MISSAFRIPNSDFLLGSGYHAPPGLVSSARGFAPIWYRNLQRYAKPAHIVIITTGEIFPVYAPEIQQVRTSNLGHVGELLSGEKASRLCGWSASVLTLCLIAYNDQRDLVYLEQDALAFGPWLRQAYDDMGDATASPASDMVFGRKHESAPWMPCSQSLFIIRHRFLLEFVARYLALPPDVEMNPEGKFHELKERDPASFSHLSFGVDRERPIPWESPVWYAQRFTGDELEEARTRGLL